jgi:hypothetical protein
MSITFSKHNPQTLDEAVDALMSDLDPEETMTIKFVSPSAFHHTVGREMRNKWKLWQEDSPLALYFASVYKLTHADDMSGMILAAMFTKVRGATFDDKAQAKRYHDHWEKFGGDG